MKNKEIDIVDSILYFFIIIIIILFYLHIKNTYNAFKDLNNNLAQIIEFDKKIIKDCEQINKIIK